MIVDSSVLIHLTRIGRLDLLKEFGDIKITEDVYRETVEEPRGKPGVSSIKEACVSWIAVCKVGGRERVKELAEEEGIEEADASVVLMAEEGVEILLSNDYALIKVARSRGVKCWWPTTLLLQALKGGKMGRKEAGQILLELVESGMWLGVAVYAAILNRMDEL